MNNKIKKICDYLAFLYDMQYFEKNNILFIKNQDDTFKVNLTDGRRFSYYTLYHKNHIKNNPGWHIQIKAMSLYRILFIAFAHYFHVSNHLYINREDIDRFIRDIHKYNFNF